MLSLRSPLLGSGDESRAQRGARAVPKDPREPRAGRRARLTRGRMGSQSRTFETEPKRDPSRRITKSHKIPGPRIESTQRRRGPHRCVARPEPRRQEFRKQPRHVNVDDQTRYDGKRQESLPPSTDRSPAVRWGPDRIACIENLCRASTARATAVPLTSRRLRDADITPPVAACRQRQPKQTRRPTW